MRSTLILVGLCVFLVGCSQDAEGPEQDPWSLRLPPAASAIPLGENPQRIVIDIINLRSEENAKLVEEGTLDLEKTPIILAGRQLPNLGKLREELRIRANPRLFPDRSLYVNRIGGPGGPTWPGGVPVYPSSKVLLIRCDREQIFGWVQAVMQLCLFLPGEGARDAVLRSPLIYMVELATEGGNKLIRYLPTDKRLSYASDSLEFQDAEIILKIPRDSWDCDPKDREVLFLRNGSPTPFGRSKRLLENKDGTVTFDLDPKSTIDEVMAYIKFAHATPESQAKINAYARTPYMHVMTVLNMMVEAGYSSIEEISFSGIPNRLVTELERGTIK